MCESVCSSLGTEWEQIGCGDLIAACNYRKFIHTWPFILAIGWAYTFTIFMRLHVRIRKRCRNTHNLSLSEGLRLMFQQLNNPEGIGFPYSNESLLSLNSISHGVNVCVCIYVIME